MSRHCLGKAGLGKGIPGRGNRGAKTVVSRRVERLRKSWGGWSRDGGPRRSAFTFDEMKAPEGGDLQFEEALLWSRPEVVVIEQGGYSSVNRSKA